MGKTKGFGRRPITIPRRIEAPDPANAGYAKMQPHVMKAISDFDVCSMYAMPMNFPDFAKMYPPIINPTPDASILLEGLR
jgi:hypothetical protein